VLQATEEHADVTYYALEILMLLFLSAVYALVILGLVLLLLKLGVSQKVTIALSFLIFGMASGILTAAAWPLDSSVYPNVFASFLGDRLYTWTLQVLADPTLPDGHHSIPWLLDLPRMYMVSSVVLSALIGLPLQWAWIRRRRPRV
jgi:hypothetical protein